MHTHPTTLATSGDLDDSWADTLKRLQAFVAARVVDRELAADITQDVIVRSIASGALKRVDNPAAWLYRSARNAVIDHYRTRRAHDPLTDPDAWPDPDSNDDQPNEATRQLSRCLQPLLDQMPSAAREALARVDVEGQTQQAAAGDLGLSVSGMKSRVQRARRDLKQLLEQCCIVELDAHGAVASYHPRSADCGCAAAPTKCALHGLPDAAKADFGWLVGEGSWSASEHHAPGAVACHNESARAMQTEVGAPGGVGDRRIECVSLVAMRCVSDPSSPTVVSRPLSCCTRVHVSSRPQSPAIRPSSNRKK